MSLLDSEHVTKDSPSQAYRRKPPENVHLKIGTYVSTIPWKTFMSLLTCCHSFETNEYPRGVRSADGEVEVRLL